MKPAPFVHHAPRSVEEAVAVLAQVGHDGKVLAGGQSLIPILNMRLASPGHLVDLGSAIALCLAWSSGRHRVPDPLAEAHTLSRVARNAEEGVT